MRNEGTNQFLLESAMRLGILLMCFFWAGIPPAAATEVTAPARAFESSGQSDPTEAAKVPKPVGPVNSSTGGVYEKGEYGIIFKLFHFAEDQLYEGNDKIDFVRPERGETPGKKCFERTTSKYQATLRAGLFENFDARLVIPYFDKEMKRQSVSRDFTDDNSGIGDVKLLGRYRILSQKKKDFLNMAVGAGVQIPTGATDETDDNGTCLPGFLQPGSGSWDPIIELGAHKVMGRHWFSTYFMYRMTTEGELGDQDFERPDVFKYNFAYAHAISHLFDLQMELNGEYKGKAELNGETKEDTGGHMVYLTPGIHFKFYKKMHFDICAPIPVYRDLNGAQLSEDYRIVAKLALKF